VFPVHGVGGIIGTLAVGVFAAVDLGGAGFSAGSMGRQLGVQAIGVLATAVWSGALSYVLLKLIDATVGLRVDAESETTGLDISLHEERGYDL
jgi:Amt family ammonium transporter